MRKIIFLVATSAFLFACNKDNNKDNIIKGEEVTVHGGKAWSTAKLDKKGAPEAVSLTINDAVLNSVPVGGPMGHDHANDFVIPLPKKVQDATSFQFIMLNWNPNGHEPDGVYTLPHFDMHFYRTTVDEVMNYTDTTKMEHNLPNAAYVPANYIAPAPGVPMMGKHWIDVNAPELHGQTFTETLLYGSYDSKVVFLEPMITLNFLKNTSFYERSIPQPTRYEKSGYYPTKLHIVKHDGVTEIVLDGFAYRQAS